MKGFLAKERQFNFSVVRDIARSLIFFEAVLAIKKRIAIATSVEYTEVI